MISVSVPLVPMPIFNGSHLRWDVDPGSFPIIRYYFRISGGHCNTTSLWYRSSSNFTKIDNVIFLMLKSDDFLYAGALYSAKVKASNGFLNSSWSENINITTFSERKLI